MGGSCSTHGKGEIFTKFCVENLKYRDRSEDLDVDGRIILMWILEEKDWRTVTGFV
jgi:hypothetical protein